MPPWFNWSSYKRMAGALSQVGLGKLTIGEFGTLVESAQQGAAGPMLPAHGLTLLAVRYQGTLTEKDRKITSAAIRGTDDYLTENV